MVKSDWRIIQLDYEAGVSQKTIRDKYGISASTLNSRIKRHGWQVTGKKPGAPGTTKYQGEQAEVKQRERHVPNTTTRSKVQMLVIAGFDSLQVAHLLDIDHGDILLHYQREIDTAFENATAQVGAALYSRAVSKDGGNVANQAAKLWHELYANKQAGGQKRPAKTCRDDIEDAQILYRPLPPPKIS